MLKYQQEFLNSFIPEVSELAERDWLEVQHNTTAVKLDPDWDSYKSLEKQGSLYVFTCRDDNKLVGYFTALIVPNLHSKGHFRVMNDAIFLDKPYRKGFAGVRLIKFAEDCIKQDGHSTLLINTTEINPIDKLMDRLGYTKIVTSFEKEL
jgi:GNAT superfamily N-acetyltransferase